MEERTDRFTAIEDRLAGYEVYDHSGSKIGKVDDLFVDESDNPEYIGVKMGFLGTSSTLIPWEAVSSTDDEGKAITVATDKDTAKSDPAFDDDREITPEFEQQVYSYYGLSRSSGSDGSYGSYYSEESTEAGTVGPGMSMGDTESGEFREHAIAGEGVEQSQRDDLEEDTKRGVEGKSVDLGGCRITKKKKTHQHFLE